MATLSAPKKVKVERLNGIFIREKHFYGPYAICKICRN